MKKGILLMIVLTTFFLISNAYAENKIITVDIPINPYNELKPLYTTYTEYTIVGNLLKYKIDTQLHNIKTFNYTTVLYSDSEKNLILDYSLTVNGLKKDIKPVISFDKIIEDNKVIFLSNLSTFEASAGDRFIQEYTVTNKIIPLEGEFLSFKFNRSEFYFPFDAYYFDTWYSPNPIHELGTRVIYSNNNKILNDKTSLTCPNILGVTVYQNKTNIAYLNFDYGNITVGIISSEKTFIEDGNNLFVIFKPIVSSQSGLIKAYEQSPNKYSGDERIGCKLKVSYERTDLIKFIFFMSTFFIFIISILILTLSRNKIELISLSFVIWSFQEALLPFNGLQRPVGITLFDLTIILLPLFAILLLVLKRLVSRFYLSFKKDDKNMINKEKHDLKAKEYAEKRKKKAEFYYKLFFSSTFSIFLLLFDFISGVIPNIVKVVTLLLLLPTTYMFYRKWNYLTKTQIMTAQLPTGEILVNSVDIKKGTGGIKFRIGGDRFIDKIKKFFEEM